MSLARTLTRLAFLAAIGHQVTDTVVEGAILEDARRRVSRLHPKADQFVHCHLCVGTWVGVLLAGVYRPNLLADVEGRPPGPVRQVANLAGDAVLIALGSRVWNELLGWVRRERQVKLEAPDGSAEPEAELSVLPGISIRPQRFGISH